MRREEKYPDTETFHFYNANPKGKYTTDCVIRAISVATDIPYEAVLREMAEQQIRTGYDMSETKAIEKYLKTKGWRKQPQPRKEDNTKYTGEEFCQLLSVNERKGFGNVIANIGGHHIVAIVPSCMGDGINDRFKVYDTWNSTGGCIGNYWIK